LADELTEDGRAIVPLTSSSPVDPRARLPFEQREVETRTLSNGTVVTTYKEPPLTADQYRANLPDYDDYEAMIEDVIAEVDAEDESGRQDAAAKANGKRQEEPEAHRHPRSDWDPAPLNRLGIWARKKREAEEVAKKAAEGDAKAPEGDPERDPWERLNGSS
jgi:hypothetical protein